VPLYPETGIVTTYNGPTSVPKGAQVTIIAQATSRPSESLSISLNVAASASAKLNDSEEPPPKAMAHASRLAAGGGVCANEPGRETVQQNRGRA
jgi:hypothetical protein